jgi:hypothetical protein
VNGSRHQFFPGARFARDQNCRAGLGHFPDGFKYWFAKRICG